jgi:hypothetical protein
MSLCRPLGSGHWPLGTNCAVLRFAPGGAETHSTAFSRLLSGCSVECERVGFSVQPLISLWCVVLQLPGFAVGLLSCQLALPSPVAGRESVIRGACLYLD